MCISPPRFALRARHFPRGGGATGASRAAAAVLGPGQAGLPPGACQDCSSLGQALEAGLAASQAWGSGSQSQQWGCRHEAAVFVALCPWLPGVGGWNEVPHASPANSSPDLHKTTAVATHTTWCLDLPQLLTDMNNFLQKLDVGGCGPPAKEILGRGPGPLLQKEAKRPQSIPVPPVGKLPSWPHV